MAQGLTVARFETPVQLAEQVKKDVLRLSPLATAIHANNHLLHLSPKLIKDPGRRSFRHPGPGRTQVVLRPIGEKTVGVPGAVDVEADQISVVVEAVDGGGPNTVWVVDRLPLGMRQRSGQQEAVHLARAVDIGASDLISQVDAQGGRVGRVREIELGEGRPFEQETDGVAIGGRQEADDVAVVVDAGGQCIVAPRRDDGAELAGALV